MVTGHLSEHHGLHRYSSLKSSFQWEHKAKRTCLASFSVVSRAHWGAAPPKRRENLRGPAQKVVIHHTALPKCSGLSGCRDRLLSIQRSHMNDRNFDDIGYKWVATRFHFHPVDSIPPCITSWTILGFKIFWNLKSKLFVLILKLLNSLTVNKNSYRLPYLNVQHNSLNLH